MDQDLTSIADILRARAAESPDQVAMRFEGRDTRLGALDQRSSQVAHGLIRSLPEPQARVGVLDTNSDVFFELLFGAAKAGRVLVPINNRLTPPEIASIVNDAALGMLFVGAEFLGIAETLGHGCPTVRQIVTLDGHRPGWDDYTWWRDRESTSDPRAPAGQSDVILLVYTSGTTGQPKGTVLTHECLLTNAPLLAQEHGSSPGTDAALVCMPLFHVSGSLWGLSCFYAGVRLVILRRINPIDILRTIAEHRVTMALLVPAVIQVLLDAADRESYDLSSLDFVLYGASPISPTLLRRAMTTLNCRFGQVYGLTETAGSITYLAPEDHDVANPTRLMSCGKPLRHAQIRVVDASGVALPTGQIGEIVCQTTQNMQGYWQRPEETAAALKHGWLHTGDAGFFDADGYLYIHDRIKDMIISGGENVYPVEIERVLSAHAAVADVAVIGVPDDRWGESAKAFVVRRAGATITPDELLDFCRQHIAAYKVPKSVDFVDVLKRNAAGKLLKQELRAPYWSGRTRQVN